MNEVIIDVNDEKEVLEYTKFLTWLKSIFGDNATISVDRDVSRLHKDAYQVTYNNIYPYGNRFSFFAKNKNTFDSEFMKKALLERIKIDYKSEFKVNSRLQSELYSDMGIWFSDYFKETFLRSWCNFELGVSIESVNNTPTLKIYILRRDLKVDCILTETFLVDNDKISVFADILNERLKHWYESNENKVKYYSDDHLRRHFFKVDIEALIMGTYDLKKDVFEKVNRYQDKLVERYVKYAPYEDETTIGKYHAGFVGWLTNSEGELFIRKTFK